MKINVPNKMPNVYTHEGAVASKIRPEESLRRLAATCMLWEDNFYEDGLSIASRIEALVPQCKPEFVAECAVEMRTKQKLRHAPLLLVRTMAKASPSHRHLVGPTLPKIIQRADELAEFLAIYWKGGKTPISKQVKKGLREAFLNFNEYDFAKYNRDGAVKLRDVLFMVHAKPKTPEQEILFKKIVDNKLETPETWEVQLSAGGDKREVFTSLMEKKKLGALAFIRNLRNMYQAGVEKSNVRAYSERVNIERVLPFQFLTAARHVPAWEDIIEPMMMRGIAGMSRFTGKTKILVDVSGSMNSAVSSKSQLIRADAAIGVAILARELCEDVEIFSFNNSVKQMPPRRGFALRDSFHIGGGTYLGKAISVMNSMGYDRLIVITDEQSSDAVGKPLNNKSYIINVASNSNGVGYGSFVKISGWSEHVLSYIQEYESFLEGK